MEQLEIRHLSHHQARNFVVLSTPSMSEQPHHLFRLVHNITNLPEVQYSCAEVVGWLETTSNVPDEVKCKCDDLLSAQHFELAASDFVLFFSKIIHVG